MFEKVNPKHPDKVADRIAGAIVDLAYKKQQNPKVAVEVLLGHGDATVIAESSVTFTHHEVQTIVDRICEQPMHLFYTCVKQDWHLASNQNGKVRCGDNGIFKGCVPTQEQKLLTNIAGDIYKHRPYDGKYILNDGNITICQSHLAKGEPTEWLIECMERGFGLRKRIIVNPLGEWTGGTDVDCGATNRKLGSDMGDGVTGGGLHGKDLSKADVSVNIWCYIESIKQGKPVTACCSIGDEKVNGIPYEEIVETARMYIESIGGFEKFAEWGLIRPE